MKYYDLKHNWGRVKPHLTDPRVQAVLVRDFNKFTWGRWGKRFEPGMTPAEFESCDWDCDHRGRRPRYWDYVKHAACHWLANFNLRLAERVQPSSPWRVLTSDLHSTVWDGDQVLFDFNYQALGITPDECYRMAAVGVELPPGKEMKVFLAEHWSVDAARARAESAVSA